MGDLKDFLLHDETSLDLLYRIHKLNARTGLKRLDRFINNGKGLFPGECVTVTGAHGSGKSSLLRAIAVNAVLPRFLGGCEQPVVFFDNSWSGSSQQFRKELKHTLQTRMANHAVDIESRVPNSADGGSIAGTKAGIHRDGDDDGIIDDIAIDDLDFADVDEDFADTFVISSGGDSAAATNNDGAGTVNDTDSLLLQECLNRILIVRCKNSFEFLVSLGGLMLRPEIRDGSGFALVLIDSLSSFHLHDVSCPRGQAEKTHRIINSLLKRIATRHHIPIVAAKPISVTADQSREFEPAIWVGLRAWDVCLARATTTRVKDERKTFVKVEVRRFDSLTSNANSRKGTVMLTIDDNGVHD